MRRVYLDHSATTPVDPRVVEAMLPYLTAKFGNPSSVHFYGQEARAAVDRARREVADLVGARPNEVVFLSGGTEANNLAVRGHCEQASDHGRHVITTAIEHSSVRGICESLERRDWEVTRLPVYDDGVVRVEDVRAALRPDTVLVTVMLANNEIGTIQPLPEIAALVRERREAGQKHLRLHTDAVQGASGMRVDVDELGCDLLSMSAHKLYAPKGVGALYVRRGVRLAQQNIGGHQERERRGGTEAVPFIVAFGEAARLTRVELEERSERSPLLTRALRVGRRVARLRHRPQRRPRAAPARRLEHLVPLHRGRGAAHQPRHAGRGRLDGFGLLFGLARTLARHPRFGARRRAGARLHPLQPRQGHDRQRRSTTSSKSCPAPSRICAASRRST